MLDKIVHENGNYVNFFIHTTFSKGFSRAPDEMTVTFTIGEADAAK